MAPVRVNRIRKGVKGFPKAVLESIRSKMKQSGHQWQRMLSYDEHGINVSCTRDRDRTPWVLNVLIRRLDPGEESMSYTIRQASDLNVAPPHYFDGSIKVNKRIFVYLAAEQILGKSFGEWVMDLWLEGCHDRCDRLATMMMSILRKRNKLRDYAIQWPAVTSNTIVVSTVPERAFFVATTIPDAHKTHTAVRTARTELIISITDEDQMASPVRRKWRRLSQRCKNELSEQLDQWVRWEI